MCPNKGKLTCLCKCKDEKTFFDLKMKVCRPFDNDTLSGHCPIKEKAELKKKIPIEKIPVVKLKKVRGNNIMKKRPERRHYRDGHIQSPANGDVIDDDFPVWAITILVSCFVTAAMGTVIYFY